MPEARVHCCGLRLCALASSIIVCATLAGCSTSPDSGNAGAAAPAAITIAAASTPQPGDDNGRGDGYDFVIHYPQIPPEWKALDNILHAYAQQSKAEFLANALKSAAPATATPQHLQLNFSIATQTSDFVSALANGKIVNADARVTPILASFTVHLPNGALVSLVNLFTDADAALKALSVEARRQLNARFDASLREGVEDGKKLAAQSASMHIWVEKSTAAQAASFSVFLVDGVGGGKAIGLTLIFARDPSAAYMDGDPQVEVPSKVFYALLKPEYRDAFSIDPEDLKRLGTP